MPLGFTETSYIFLNICMKFSVLRVLILNTYDLNMFHSQKERQVFLYLNPTSFKLFGSPLCLSKKM